MVKGKSTWSRERILANITIDSKTGCWYIHGGGINGGKPRSPHRRVWVEWHGPVPIDHWILHKCKGNGKCCNPSHIYLGSQSDNQLDRYNIDRHKPHFFYSWAN